jgi:hypothetical protein
VEVDLGLWIAANVTPYGVAVAVALFWRPARPRSWPASLPLAGAVYAGAIALAPVGGLARAREGWPVYAVLFVLLGGITWVSLFGWWLTWRAWAGRLEGVRPLATALFALCADAVAWLWPASSLPGGSWWIPVAALPGAGLLVAGVVSLRRRAS